MKKFKLIALALSLLISGCGVRNIAKLPETNPDVSIDGGAGGNSYNGSNKTKAPENSNQGVETDNLKTLGKQDDAPKSSENSGVSKESASLDNVFTYNGEEISYFEEPQYMEVLEMASSPVDYSEAIIPDKETAIDMARVIFQQIQSHLELWSYNCVRYLGYDEENEF